MNVNQLKLFTNRHPTCFIEDPMSNMAYWVGITKTAGRQSEALILASLIALRPLCISRYYEHLHQLLRTHWEWRYGELFTTDSPHQRLFGVASELQAPYMWRGTKSEASSGVPLEAIVASSFGSFNSYPVDRFFIIMPPSPSSHHARPLQPTPQLSHIQQELGDASQPHSRPPRSKGVNFTPDEECQLCRFVLHVNQDPRVGNGQKNATFWDMITTHFNNVAPSGKRPERSLESKWSAIKHDISKFVGVHSYVEDLRRSGTSEADILVEVLDLYKIKHPKGASFTYMHCWYLLRNVPRWVEGGISESRRSPSRPLSSRSRLEMSGGNEIDSDCASQQAQPQRTPIIPST